MKTQKTDLTPEERAAIIKQIDAVVVGCLNDTGRAGIQNLTKHIKDIGFFTAPSSRKYHSAYEGGLARHSFDVLQEMYRLTKRLKVTIPEDNMIIAALLHDVCKAGAYIKTGDTYDRNPDHPKGHAQLSLSIIKEFIELTPIEEAMIKYHMGVWGTIEHSSSRGEYTLKDLTTALNAHPEVKIMCMADDIASLMEAAGK